MTATEVPIQPLTEIPPERAKDVALARRLFDITKVYQPYGVPGWLFYIPKNRPWRTHSLDATPLPKFSQEIQPAWQIVMAVTDPRCPGTREYPPGTYFGYWWDRAVLWAMNEAEAADAICTAALKALGPEPPPRRARVAQRRAEHGRIPQERAPRIDVGTYEASPPEAPTGADVRHGDTSG